MSLTSDLLVDRRRLRRQLTLWRVLAVLVALGAVLAAGLMFGGAGLRPNQPHIARITIEGLITGKQETVDLLRRAENDGAKAVILRINSGGGTTSGSETLYNEIRRLAGKKPVVAVIDGVGASGAYMAAIGTDRIFANGSAMVGSIGVIAQYPNFSKLLENVGVKVEAVRSSPLKAMPSGVEPTSPEARAALEETITESYRWFRGLVGERRQLSGDALSKVADGRVFTGRQAIDLKLIDALGGEDAAVAWLEAEKGLAKGLKIQPYVIRQPLNRFPTLTSLAGLVGLADAEGAGVLREAAREVMGGNALDGLVSVWHPSGE
ncbi:MAG: signal peptide peptidase SppA [Rhizobiales bacterium PAR1]|nr:MAG: signal peptide peptidase SppA [Rhizobiales bacterium PAR1]